MVRRDLFVSLGGMHEAFAMIYQDVDLCLRIRELGKSILYVSNATLSHHESVSRGPHYNYVDRELFIDRWGDELVKGDPFYNPNFTRNLHSYNLR
jgi:GT2 family glycosyltransferase